MTKMQSLIAACSNEMRPGARLLPGLGERPYQRV